MKDALHGFIHIFLKEYFLRVSENQLSDYRTIFCGVPQSLILGPLYCFVYVNDMPQAVNSNLSLYVDYSCPMFQDKDVETVEKLLKNDIKNIYDWFVNKKLSTQFFWRPMS